MSIDLSAIVTLVLTASGGAFVREVLIGVAKLRAGVAGSERGRRSDVIAQRDAAVKAHTDLEHKVDVLDRYASDLREFCLAHGTPLNSLPARPTV